MTSLVKMFFHRRGASPGSIRVVDFHVLTPSGRLRDDESCVTRRGVAVICHWFPNVRAKAITFAFRGPRTVSGL
jgi:hypothetical protein